MLCSAKLYQALSPPNESLESKEAACYVAIRIFASMSCGRGRAGTVGCSHRALGCNKKLERGREEMQVLAVCFANVCPLTANSAVCC